MEGLQKAPRRQLDGFYFYFYAASTLLLAWRYVRRPPILPGHPSWFMQSQGLMLASRHALLHWSLQILSVQ